MSRDWGIVTLGGIFLLFLAICLAVLIRLIVVPEAVAPVPPAESPVVIVLPASPSPAASPTFSLVEMTPTTREPLSTPLPTATPTPEPTVTSTPTETPRPAATMVQRG